MTTEDRETPPVGQPDSGDSRSSSFPDPAAGSRPARRRRLRWWHELVVLALVAVLGALAIKTFVVQPFYIPSESMEPGLVEDDRILVEKVSSWAGEPERGDVVVFADPGGWLPDTGGEDGLLTRMGLQPGGGHLVKRVIGVAGDTVSCCDDEGRLQVNGVSIDEPYARPDDRGCYGPMKPSCEWTAGPVPEGELFVMGDNRAESADSSYRLCPAEAELAACDLDPYVDTDLVVGRLAAVVWPPGRFDLGGGTDAFDEVPDP